MIDFVKKFGHLQVKGFKKSTLKTTETSVKSEFLVPKQYRKRFTHSPNGFFENYCKEKN